jgi:hypothetical protein
MTEACESRKKSFATAELAYAHSDYLRSKHGTTSHVYSCGLCCQWHLTTTTQFSTEPRVRLTLGDRARQVYATKK